MFLPNAAKWPIVKHLTDLLMVGFSNQDFDLRADLHPQAGNLHKILHAVEISLRLFLQGNRYSFEMSQATQWQPRRSGFQ